MRIVALVAVLALLGLVGSMLFLGGGSSEPTQTAAASTPAAPTVARTTPDKASTTAKPATHSAKPATKPKPAVLPRHAAKPKHVAKPKPLVFHGNKVYATLPKVLQWQLAHHKIVVVSVYNPRSEVDGISVAEAHAGALDAGAGFLLVSVLDNDVAGILTGLLPNGGLLPNPGVLVYRAPGDIALRLDGFADRDSVAQAATNALHGDTGPAPSDAVSGASPAALPTYPATVTP
jgi:hypothetical protein